MASPTRLKSSFIYLANAVNDLRGNWRTFALVLAPLVILGALCLLPDALNLQHELAEKFAPGTHNVGWWLAQEPDMPTAEQPKPLFAWWLLQLSHLALLALAFAVDLVVLCTIRRNHEGLRHERLIDEALAVYREAGCLVPGFYWVVLLQVCIPAAAFFITTSVDWHISEAWVVSLIYLFQVGLLVLAALVYLWLYFARCALVFDGQRSFHALLFSRDLMRKRFFRIGTRIVVFLAVWSGYSSWAAGAFFFVSVVVGPVGALTGYLWGTIFGIDLATTAVTFVTTAFFTAAGLRLYQDARALATIGAESPAEAAVIEAVEPATAG